MLKEYLDPYFQDEELKHIFRDVVGSDSSKQIQPLIEKAVKHFLHSSIKEILFIQSSIGVVFGFLLSDGRKVVLKVYSDKISLDYLEKMNAIQTIFNQKHFPAPKVLSPIFPFVKTFGGLYELIEGKKEDGHQPFIRTELAHKLAWFSDIVDKHQLEPLPNFFQQAMTNRLWPIPHNVLFDLKKTSKGAGWIAKKAQEARKILYNHPLKLKLAHTDWGVKNAIFVDQKITGIFDWDSLGAMSEPEMVGRAAAQFTADWETEFKITPTPQEAREFVESYQQFRHIAFSKEEYKVVSAAADSLIAIIARFEHAGGGMLHPYQDLLKQCGNTSFLFS